MAIRMPRIIHATRILRHFPSSIASNVPKGSLAVYIGEKEKTRFVVSISILNQPLFQELLGLAEQEFRFEHPMGGLTIPCREEIFIDLISQLRGL